MVELRYLRYLSQNTGLGLNYLSKEEKISLLLRQLSETIKNGFVLKGGTPISRIYLSKIDKARFSEDLDFDYISKESFKEKINQLSMIMKKIKDFDISRPRIQFRTVRFDCYYTNELGSRDRIMVDYYVGMNTIKVAVDPKIIMVEPIFVPSVSSNLLVYSLEDLIARKIITLNNRSEGKDIYDLFYMLDMKFDKKKLYTGISIMLDYEKIDIEPKKFIQNLVVSTEKMNALSQQIGKATNHYIPLHLRPIWSEIIPTLAEKIKNHLL